MEIHEMPEEVQMVDTITVSLIDWMASDDAVVQAAQVSSVGANNADTDVPRLINALMKDRHGSPFEHTAFKFFIEAPLFVVNEHNRHRHASINQMSGRYTVLPPRFYSPPADRGIVNSGTRMRPNMTPGTRDQQRLIETNDWSTAQEAWNSYQRRLKAGIAPELARTILPLHIMTQLYWTVNARGLMNYLSLRTHDESATTVSYPQHEIELVAREVEEHFRRLMPYTHEAFNKNGRVGP